MGTIFKFFMYQTNFFVNYALLLKGVYSNIILLGIRNHISHLLYFMHRPGWALTVIICPLKSTSKGIMVINLHVPSSCTASLYPTVHTAALNIQQLAHTGSGYGI